MIGEVEEIVGTTRKSGDGREADVRLANRLSLTLSLPPLGTELGMVATGASGSIVRMYRFFSPASMAASDWRAPRCSRGLPMLHAIALNGSFFNSHRMLAAYVSKAYAVEQEPRNVSLLGRRSSGP